MLDLSVDSFHFYFLVAVLQGFVLSVLIIFNKPIKVPSICLGLLVLFFSFYVLHGVLEEGIHAFNTKFPVPMDFSFSFGPLVYFHVRLIIKPESRFSIKDLVHFIPSFLFDIVLFTSAFTYLRYNMDWAYDHIPQIQLVAIIISLLGMTQLSIYIFFMYKLVRNASIKPEEFAQNLKKWFKNLTIIWFIILGFLCLALPIALFNVEIFDDNSYMIYKPMGTIIGVCIYWLGYQYLLKYMKTVNRYLERAGKMQHIYTKIESKKTQLVEVLEKEEIFKNKELNLEKLAKHLEWPIRDVSLTIAEAFNSNFNDLINSYRVNAFKELVTLPEYQKYSIAGLAEEVGFNSKASFYRAFKKVCGQTPKEYLDGLSG